MKKLLILGLVLLVLAGCSPLPQPTEPAPLVLPEPPVIQQGVAAVSAAPFAGLRHAWPRIGTTDGDYNPSEATSDHIADVASHQVVLWTLPWPDYSADTRSTLKTPFEALRALNPAIATVGVTHTYLVPWSGCGSAAFNTICRIWQAVDGNDWYAYDATGKKLSTATGWWINWTRGYDQWLADFLSGQAARQCGNAPCWKGFYVEMAGPPHGIGSFFSADLDRDGRQDMAEGRLTKCQLDAAQMDGYARLMQTVNRLTGLPIGGESFGPGLDGPASPNYFLGKETLYFDGEFPFGAWPDCSKDPYGGSGGYTYLGDAWGMHMASALAAQDAGTIGVLLRGAGGQFADENQARRFILASGAMTDHYTVVHLHQLPWKFPCDECLVNAAGRSTSNPADLGWAGDPLGEPFRPRDGVTMRQAIARGERLADDVWCRFFEMAVSCVNPTTSPQTVNLPDGFAAVNAAGRPGGDTVVNNGRPVRSMTIAAGDGRFLRRVSTVGTAVPPSSTPTLASTSIPRPTSTPTPSRTPTATATLTELEALKRRVDVLETVVAGLQ